MAVVAENLIRAENTAVTSIDEIIKFHDEPRFHRTVHTLCLRVSNPYGPPGRDCGSTPLDRRCFNSARRGVCASSNRTGSSGFCGLGLPEWRRWLRILKPDTVVGWHRSAFARYWTWKSRRRPGRPAVAVSIRDLIRRMSRANRLWGAPRIHGELLKL